MDTRKAKLVTGLLVAGTVAGGLGASVLPASAQPRQIVVTLLGGKQLTLTIDVPPGTPLDQLKLPGIDLPIIAVQEVGGGAPVVTVPGVPGAAGGQAPAPAPAPDTPNGTEGQPGGKVTTVKPSRESTKGSKKGKLGDSVAAVTTDTVAVARKRAERAKRRAADGRLRRADGTPTIQNPSYALADIGPAPIGVPNFFIEKFRIPPFLLPIYQAAGIEYGVRWEVLAAINEIETDYGRNLNVSSAGALGWMQFMPATWKAYGVDANRDGKKDPYNPVDAIFAAARYLKAAGFDQDVRKAVFAYNHADWYVDSVLMRARLIGGMPSDLVGSLTGLTQAHFPVHATATYADDLSEAEARKRVAKGRNAAVPVESDAARRGIDIFAKAGSPAIAVQDGRIVAMGRSKRLGNFVQLRDVYGNTYTYGGLKKVAKGHPVPKQSALAKAAAAEKADRETPPAKDPKPTLAASAGSQAPIAKAKVAKTIKATKERMSAVAKDVAADAKVVDVSKERLYANPSRERAASNGGAEQQLNTDFTSGVTTFKSYFTQVFGLDRDDVEIKRLKVGSKVVAGTILGRLGVVEGDKAPHLRFEIRPAGRGAPRIDPKPILDGWKLLESTAIYRAAGRNPLFGSDAKGPSIGQILLMSKESLIKRVLANPRIDTYAGGRQDIASGQVDRRVLATLEFLAASGLEPTVTSLKTGHGFLTASGNVSHHSSGNAVDIAKVNGQPILGNQGAGSITDMTIRRLLTLQGTMKPAQIISLMTYDGADNTLALPDHGDHIHLGWQPLYGSSSKTAKQLDAVLKPTQWIKLIDRLGDIDNPDVLTSPSKYAIKAKKSERGSDAHVGE